MVSTRRPGTDRISSSATSRLCAVASGLARVPRRSVIGLEEVIGAGQCNGSSNAFDPVSRYHPAMPLAPSPNCPRCGALLPPTALVCPACGTFVHAKELSQLSAQALQLEPIDPRGAAAIWQQTLELIPADSPQYRMVTERMAKLAVGIRPAGPLPGASPPRRRPSNDSLTMALLKTFGSMLLSIVVYAVLLGNVILAAALVVLILVHEM